MREKTFLSKNEKEDLITITIIKGDDMACIVMIIFILTHLDVMSAA